MISVNPLNFVKINNIRSTKKHFQNTLASDTFVRSSNNVSFKGEETKQSNPFLKWAEENNFSEDQLDLILMNPKNKIGSGFQHTTYNIPNCDDFILRMPTFFVDEIFNSPVASINDVQDKNLTVNVGQSVAEIVVPTSRGYSCKIEVLQKQKGKSHGVPPYEALTTKDYGPLRNGELPYEARERKEHYAQSIHDVANLPFDAYKKLITDLLSAEKAGYSLDHLNSNNLLIDKENGSINVIDMCSSKLGVNLGNILYSLTNINYFNTYTSRYDEAPMSENDVNQVFGDTIQIIDKFLNAIKDLGLKLDRNSLSMESQKVFSSYPFACYCQTWDDDEKWAYLEKMGVAENN